MKKDLQSKVESSSDVNQKTDKKPEKTKANNICIPPVITYEIDKRYYTFVYNRFAGETRSKEEMISALMRINYF